MASATSAGEFAGTSPIDSPVRGLKLTSMAGDEEAFRAGLFFATGFFAVVFFAVDFLAVAFLAVVFFVALDFLAPFDFGSAITNPQDLHDLLTVRVPG